MKIQHDNRFSVEDIDDVIPEVIRTAMLEVVLAWASLDGAVSMLCASIHGLDDEEHADSLSNERTHSKLRRIQLALRSGAPNMARAIGRLKKGYEGQSEIRDTIAHCHCRGVLRSEPERAVFLRYRKAPTGGLIVDRLHLEQFREAARFGRHWAVSVSY